MPAPSLAPSMRISCLPFVCGLADHGAPLQPAICPVGQRARAGGRATADRTGNSIAKARSQAVVTTREKRVNGLEVVSLCGTGSPASRHRCENLLPRCRKDLNVFISDVTVTLEI